MTCILLDSQGGGIKPGALHPDQQRVVPIEISEETAEHLAQSADRVVDILNRGPRRAWPAPHLFTEPGTGDSWLNVADYAITSGIAVWCDDRVLRGLIQNSGGAAFGTVDLMRELRRSRTIGDELANVAEAMLITEYHVDLGFDIQAMRLAAEAVAWRVEGAATALSRAATWSVPESPLGFYLEACAAVQEGDPSALRGWTACAAIGLIQIAGDAEGATRNLCVLLARTMTQGWIRPDALAFVVAGVRDAVDFEKAEIEDPLADFVRATYTALAPKWGWAASAHFITVMTSLLNDADKSTVARTILTAHQVPPIGAVQQLASGLLIPHLRAQVSESDT